MRRVFNKKQLIVLWVVGIVVCTFFIFTPKEGGKVVRSSMSFRYRKINLNRVLIYPLVIIGGLLVITLGPRRLDEEEIEKKQRKLDREQREREQYEREREQRIEKMEQKERKRDNVFLIYWEHGMSDKELAKKFHLKIEGVRALKEKLNGRRRKKTPGTGSSQDKSGPYPEGQGSL